MKKDLRCLAKEAIAQGWRVEHSGGHWKWYPPPPAKYIVVTSSTPSDYRALQNMKADLRRHGLKI